MIRLNGVVRTYGVHEVLAGVDLGLPPRSRTGLVGPNGAGKTTLLRLIAGEEEADRGTIDITRGVSIGYLPQDEPTNHLDLEAVGWLEAFLSDVPSALLVVSHDRTFLNRLVGIIAEVDRGKVTVWPGNYDRYRADKEQARALALKKAASEAHRVEEVERFIERFRYKATKARQVQSRIKMLEKMERTELRAEEQTWRFSFPPVSRSAQRVALLASVRKSFDERVVLKDLDLEIWRGDRIALVGPNGCGKSTLLKVVAGRLPADRGTVEIGDKVVLH